jgi:hypothetical protein
MLVVIVFMVRLARVALVCVGRRLDGVLVRRFHASQ